MDIIQPMSIDDIDEDMLIETVASCASPANTTPSRVVSPTPFVIFINNVEDSTNKAFTLGSDYTLNNYDVICGRGKKSLNNIGNRRFRLTTTMFMVKYGSSRLRIEKQNVVSEMIGIFRTAGGHFLKQHKATKEWFDIGDKAAAQKVGHCLRDRSAELASNIRSVYKEGPVTKKVLNKKNKTKTKKAKLSFSSATTKISKDELDRSWEQLPFEAGANLLNLSTNDGFETTADSLFDIFGCNQSIVELISFEDVLSSFDENHELTMASITSEILPI